MRFARSPEAPFTFQVRNLRGIDLSRRAARRLVRMIVC